MESISITALSGFVTLITAVFPVLAVLAIASRTRSSHTFLVHRLWQLFFNPREIDDPVVKKHIDEETVVTFFRTRYNIRIELPAQAHKLIFWAKERDLPMPAIGACGQYFDFKLCEVRKSLPSVRRTKALAIVVVLLGACSLMLFALGTSSSVLAQFKESKRHFLVNRDTATPLFPRGPAITRSSCTAQNSIQATPESFSAAEQEIVCKSFTDANEIQATKEFLKHGLQAQRWFLGGLLSILLSITAIFFWTVEELRATYRIKMALEKEPGSPEATPAPPQSEPPTTAGHEALLLQAG